MKPTIATVNEFKEHFKRVSKDRYEKEPRVTEEAAKGEMNLRNKSKAREVNELLNEMPEKEDIWEVVKKIRESTQGVDGVRIELISLACKEMKERMMEVVR